MSLDLPARAAKIGAAINTRSERHGDEDVAALDIPVTFVLDPIELCWLLKSEEAAHRLFIGVGTTHGEKALPAIGAIRLREKIEGANVSLTFTGLMGEMSCLILRMRSLRRSASIRCSPARAIAP
jgi:hypothetical protein